ncbi:unnamed protein product [Ixodes persulcatus]
MGTMPTMCSLPRGSKHPLSTIQKKKKCPPILLLGGVLKPSNRVPAACRLWLFAKRMGMSFAPKMKFCSVPERMFRNHTQRERPPKPTADECARQRCRGTGKACSKGHLPFTTWARKRCSQYLQTTDNGQDA